MQYINHVITTISRGGAEKQLLILVTEQIAQGEKVRIFFLKGNPELAQDFISSGAQVVYDLHGKNFLRQMLIFYKFVIRDSGLIHAHLPRAEILCSITTLKRGYIASRHNAEPFFPNSNKFLSSLLSKVFTLNARRVIAISDAVRQFMIHEGEILDSKKITVIYYGISARRSVDQKIANELSQRYEISGFGKVYGTIARLAPQKDFYTLLYAFSELLEVEPNSLLIIIGDGAQKKELVELQKILKISENQIRWIGRTEYIEEFLEIMDVFVFCTNYEGFGLVLLEAARAELPVLASSVSAVPEVLGVNYLGLFQPKDSSHLCSLMIKVRNSDFDQYLKNQLSLQVSKFPINEMTRRIKLVYLDCYGSELTE
jgi:glycosyltransferase involved in cell wall biosynthesis